MTNHELNVDGDVEAEIDGAARTTSRLLGVGQVLVQWTIVFEVAQTGSASSRRRGCGPESSRDRSSVSHTRLQQEEPERHKHGATRLNQCCPALFDALAPWSVDR